MILNIGYTQFHLKLCASSAVAFFVGEFGRHRCRRCHCCFVQLKVTHSKRNYAVDLYTYLWQISRLSSRWFHYTYRRVHVCFEQLNEWLNERMYCYFFILHTNSVQNWVYFITFWVLDCDVLQNDYVRIVRIPKALTIHCTHSSCARERGREQKQILLLILVCVSIQVKYLSNNSNNNSSSVLTELFIPNQTDPLILILIR